MDSVLNTKFIVCCQFLRTDGIIFPFELNDIMDDKQKIKSLKQKYDYIFKKIVDAKLAYNESKARTHATELLEVKKAIRNLEDN